jgi:serine phosphatase RsbU (regulator of sigma subunit)
MADFDYDVSDYCDVDPVRPGARAARSPVSDGVAERRDGKGNEFGIENIGRTLQTCAQATAAGTVRPLHAAVLGFSSGPLRDDAALLLVDTR